MRIPATLTAVCLILLSGCGASKMKVASFRPGTPQASLTRTVGPEVAPTATVQPGPDAPHRNIEIHFIDVKQGDATLIKCPNGQTILVDCGTLPHNDGQARKVKRYLEREVPGGKLDYVVISHPDADHYNNLPFVVGNFEIGTIYYVGTPEEYKTRTLPKSGPRAADELTRWLRAAPNARALTPTDTGTALFSTGDVRVDILAADVPATTPQDNFTVNSRSIVLKVTYRDFDAILTADATRDTERHIMNKHQNNLRALDCEVLKIGHHGSSATSTSAEWAAAVQAEAAVASAAWSNDYGHPRQSVVEELEPFAFDYPASQERTHKLKVYSSQTQSRTVRNYRNFVFCTGSNGNVKVVSDGSGTGGVANFDVVFDR